MIRYPTDAHAVYATAAASGGKGFATRTWKTELCTLTFDDHPAGA